MAGQHCSRGVLARNAIGVWFFDVLLGATAALGTVLSWIFVETDFARVLVRAGKFGLPPFEDAAMLFRYAENLAAGAGIVWNVGEAPGVSDGATDLGFVFAIASLVKLGVSSATAATIISLSAVAATGAAFAALNRLTWGLRPGPLAAAIVFVMIGPVSHYISAGFSPPVFGFLLLAASSLTYLAVLREGQNWALGVSAGAIAGLAGWWRPEGFVLGPIVMMLACIAATIFRPMSGSWRVVYRAAIGALVAFLPVSVLWLCFRVVYFGNVLPTSAVMKGHGLHPDNAIASALFYALGLLPLVVLLMIDGRGRVTPPSRWWVLLVALALMCSVWALVDTTMNHWSRMQWPLFPVLAFLTITLIREGGSVRRAPWSAIDVMLVFLVVGVSIASFHTKGLGYFQTPFHTAVSNALASQSENTADLRLATTEAGLIPLALDPGGLALDTWGHNERSIAVSGGDTLADRLRELRPNIIVVHGYRPPNSLDQGDCRPPGDGWDSMVDKLYAFAESNGLDVLRSTETSQCNFWSVFVDAEVTPSVRTALADYSLQGRELPVAR